MLFIFIILKYPLKKNLFPNILSPVILIRKLILWKHLYEFCYVGVGIFSLNSGSFILVIYLYIFIVRNFCKIFNYVHIERTLCTIFYYIVVHICVQYIVIIFMQRHKYFTHPAVPIKSVPATTHRIPLHINIQVCCFQYIIWFLSSFFPQALFLSIPSFLGNSKSQFLSLFHLLEWPKSYFLQ